MSERREWLARQPETERARKLGVVAWAFSAVVLAVVGLMDRIHIETGVDLSFLPAVYSATNALAACALLAAWRFIKRGRVAAHKRAVLTAAGLSGAFLLMYVLYHITSPATSFGGEGLVRYGYFFLLISHILLAGISLPFILLALVSGLTNQFARHRRLVRWVFPVWLYVACTGPICYLLLLPYR